MTSGRTTDRRGAPRVAVLRDADLARRLSLPVVERPDDRLDGVLVAATPDGVELRWTGPRAPRPFRVAFDAEPIRRRLDAIRRSPLVRAVGIHKGVRTVLDATAGLGRDAFVLAAAGAHVTMVEREPLCQILVEDALLRARRAGGVTAAIAARMELVCGRAEDVLTSFSASEGDADRRPDAVYLDPMFGDAAGGKSALAKKEMQLFRSLFGSDPGDPQLVELARRVARRRVVVKRRPSAPPLGPAPTARVAGNRLRFDVYTSEHPGR